MRKFYDNLPVILRKERKKKVYLDFIVLYFDRWFLMRQFDDVFQ